MVRHFEKIAWSEAEASNTKVTMLTQKSAINCLIASSLKPPLTYGLLLHVAEQAPLRHKSILLLFIVINYNNYAFLYCSHLKRALHHFGKGQKTCYNAIDLPYLSSQFTITGNVQ